MAVLEAPNNGDAARANIKEAVEVYGAMQERGLLSTTEASARFAHMQALATVAVAQAVMHLAETIKEQAA